MSTEPPITEEPLTSEETLTGWGRTSPTRATIFRPQLTEQVKLLLDQPPLRGLIARGLGRSYGDPAQNAGGAVVDLTRLSRLIRFDAELGVVTVDAGMSLDQLMRFVIPAGWFPFVTPGTRFVTVGGSIAADIHGKNHHKDGSFCNYVDSMTLLAPAASIEASAEEESEVFWATAGGMGLTGVIVQASLRLQPIETSAMRVDTERARDLGDVLDRMDSRDHEYQYSVAWIDCLARGSSLGRSILTRGHHATRAELPTAKRASPLTFSPSTRLKAPPGIPSGLLRPATIRAFNEMWFRKSPRFDKGRIVPLQHFFHPLDGIENWNRLYGSRGFIQYQFVLPFGEEEKLRQILERLSATGHGSFLAVLKRFGPANEGLLSFPMAGWTLALDIPVGPPDLEALLDEFDELIAESSGRVYLAKDARMQPGVAAVMYPRLAEWLEIRARLDPQGVMQSDLARRLELN